MLLDSAEVHQVWGLSGFAERALIHENQVVRIPQEIPFQQASLLGCGFIAGAGAVLSAAAVQEGESVVVVGVGGVGLHAVQGAVVAGATTIVAVDLKPARLELALRLGATHAVLSGHDGPVRTVRDIPPRGANHVFDVVGARAVTTQALELVAAGGGLYLIGANQTDAGVDVLSGSEGARHVRVQGVTLGSTNPRSAIPMFARLYGEGRYFLDELVSRTIALSEIDAAYAQTEHSALARVVITDLAS